MKLPKKDTVRFITNFRELNKTIKRKFLQFLNIQDLLLKLEDIRNATSLDLTMRFDHIPLCPVSKNLLTYTAVGSAKYSH